MLLKSQGGKIPLHDEGGWLMPGLTMNLTKKPEPVLNPEQLANLRKVANLDTGDGAYGWPCSRFVASGVCRSPTRSRCRTTDRRSGSSARRTRCC
ncbi:hypothetical protein GS421_03235 [Rhodococcus hoagii]|nr:hypothetical protein [Prescottella equi]